MKVLTFGEIMLRLKAPGQERFFQTPMLEATFGGGEANVAVSLANYGMDVSYLTVLPKNAIADECVKELRKFGVDTSRIIRGAGRMGIYYLEPGANQLPSKVVYDREYSSIALAKPGDIDILVNNAGIIKRVPMLEMEAKDFRQVVDIDLVAPYIVSKAVIPGMIKKGHGKIINICSMMSELGRETVAGYAAAKGGLKMLTRNICSEFGEHNIQCNGIGPGYIATPQTAPLREIQPDGSRHPFDQFIVAKTPAARWGTPIDLMGTAVFLASDASNFVNGHVLYVDGGILAYIGKQP